MFVDENSSVDREALRNYINTQLSELKVHAQELITDSTKISFWNKLRDNVITLNEASESEKEAYTLLINQICNLPKYIDKWRVTSVDTTERLEFFVASKAEEINSGDQEHDYFWALQIRHDQLISVVRVISRLLETIEKWVTQQPIYVLDDPVFQGLLEYDIEEQIFLEAKFIHEQRSGKVAK